ncbi:crinkler (CRN) family protein [Rhizophagus irregularis DAOM 181602=DAOM 197198]|nr:crinkler (CRN) family protein [Rhizophagus irregularis DAOM 181602=DAOM 197198]
MKTKEPTVDEIKKYKTKELIDFLRQKEDDLELEEEDLEIVRRQRVNGRDFLKITEEKLEKWGMSGGPAARLADFSEECKERKLRSFFSHKIQKDLSGVCINDILRRIRNIGPVNDILHRIRNMGPVIDSNEAMRFSAFFILDKGSTDIFRVIAKFGYLPRQADLGGMSLPSNLVIRSSNEGVNPNDPAVSLRFDIINPLVRELMNKKVILVQAPPFAGKTAITQILEHSLVNAPEYSHYRVIRISLIWRGGINWDNFGEMWEQIVGVTWKEWVRQCDKIPSILIIDEAQLIYSDKEITDNDEKTADQFWMTIKGLLQEVSGINIIMFAAYGYRSSNHTGFSTPVKLPKEYCKSLIDINFSPSELRTYVHKFCNSYLKLDQQSILELYKYIQVATEGHAGLVSHILKYLEVVMNNQKALNWVEAFKCLNSKDFDSSIYTNVRAVPNVQSLKKNGDGKLKLCEDTYINGKVPFSINNMDPDASYLVKTGVLAVMDDKYLTFAAPLLRRSFFQQYYGIEDSVDIAPADLYHFIVKVFTAMCNENSGKILRETLGFGYDGRILEQTWQKEFYRIGTWVLGKNKFLSCEVGSVFGCAGRIDFYVNELDWAIELLRDGEDMQRHEDKFEPIAGKYKEIVKYAKSTAIIDIRSVNFTDNTRSEAKNVQKMRKDFIYVSCSKDFDAFKIESFGKETVFIRSQD